MSLGDNIKQLRKQKKISMKELGQAVGIGESTVCFYENNKRNPSFDTLAKIASYFNVSCSYLLGETDTPAPPESTDKDAQRLIDIYHTLPPYFKGQLVGYAYSLHKNCS